jgi:acyl homoserine lactone synthase
MRIISGPAGELPVELLSKIAYYRYRVFVQTLQWNLPVEKGVELDQFDDTGTVYVTTQDDSGDVTGFARLLPTDRPYLLGQIFPQLLNGLTPPCSSNVWELSRFAAVDFNRRPTVSHGQTSSIAAIRLLQASIDYARTRGATRLITVSPIGIERLLRRAGFHFHRAGPPVIVGGHPLCACWIELESAGAKPRIGMADVSRSLSMATLSERTLW